jgi:hypothetical protein
MSGTETDESPMKEGKTPKKRPSIAEASCASASASASVNPGEPGGLKPTADALTSPTKHSKTKHGNIRVSFYF